MKLTRDRIIELGETPIRYLTDRQLAQIRRSNQVGSDFRARAVGEQKRRGLLDSKDRELIKRIGDYDPDKNSHTPTLLERISDIIGDVDLQGVESVEFSWRSTNEEGAAYERLVVKNKGKGGHDYRGVYHPNVVCEGGGICKHCGVTLEFS